MVGPSPQEVPIARDALLEQIDDNKVELSRVVDAQLFEGPEEQALRIVFKEFVDIQLNVLLILELLLDQVNSSHLSLLAVIKRDTESVALHPQRKVGQDHLDAFWPQNL